MTKKPDWITEKKIVLPDGASALWSYDTEGDFLEIFFDEAPASGTVELAEGVWLRFDRKDGRPLSLGFTNITALTQQQEFGPPLLTLTGLKKLPDPDRVLVLKILRASPVNAILKVYSYEQKQPARVVPVASFNYPLPVAI